MVDVLMPYLKYVKNLVLRIDWNSGKRVEKLEVPILFIVGLKDELVPPQHMRKLYHNASRSRLRQLYEVKDGMHNDTWYQGGISYYNTLKEFIDKVMGMGGKEQCASGGEKEAMETERGAIPLMPKLGF